jgi:hypothetical protein
MGYQSYNCASHFTYFTDIGESVYMYNYLYDHKYDSMYDSMHDSMYDSMYDYMYDFKYDFMYDLYANRVEVNIYLIFSVMRHWAHPDSRPSTSFIMHPIPSGIASS